MIKYLVSEQFQALETILLLRFQPLADMLSVKNPDASFRVFSHSVGSSTDHQGHTIGISCILPNKLATEADLVDITVDIRGITSNPEINADVVWGHPSGRIEAEFSNAWTSVTDEGVERILTDLPRLIVAFEEAIKRGHPSQSEDDGCLL